LDLRFEGGMAGSATLDGLWRRWDLAAAGHGAAVREVLPGEPAPN
jgi:hypothetical protein